MLKAIPAARQPPCVHAASAPQDIAATRALFLEYAGWLGEDLCFQGFERELAELPGDYAAPRGRLFLARTQAGPGGEAAGCVALRPFDAGTGEVKRLYVRPAHRGSGLGTRLAKLAIESAREAGYSRLVLDTLERMSDAVRLYRGLGFSEIPPYYDNPLPGALYFSLSFAPPTR